MLPESGAISLIYRVASDIWSYVRGKKRRLTPAETLALRSRWKQEFEEQIYKRQKEKLRMDVYVVDISRLDEYPDGEHKKGKISPYFRAGLMGTYHKGVLLCLGWEGMVRDQRISKYRKADRKGNEQPELTAAIIGYVPYEYIESVDWEGDNITGLSKIYCHFTASRGEPYERVAYCEKKDLDGHPYYPELVEFKEAQRVARKAGVA